MADAWIKVVDRLPATGEDAPQAHVLFCSPGWGWAIVGLFTDFGDRHEWSAYDQQNDRYEEWGSVPPTLWMPMPEVPAA